MPLNVTIDGTNVLSLTTAQISTAAWTTYTTNEFTVSAGSHTLAFVNGTLAGDHANVIDKVNLVSVSNVAGDPTPTPASSSDSGGKCGLGSGLSAFLLMALTVMARFHGRRRTRLSERVASSAITSDASAKI
jgi:galactokinase/mevalonate kinase-like predicted kinase